MTIKLQNDCCPNLTDIIKLQSSLSLSGNGRVWGSIQQSSIVLSPSTELTVFRREPFVGAYSVDLLFKYLPAWFY